MHLCQILSAQYKRLPLTPCNLHQEAPWWHLDSLKLLTCMSMRHLVHNYCIPGCQRPSSASSLIQTLSALMNLMSVSASSSVVCLCRLSAGRTKQQAWQFHESVRDKDKPGATCCVHYGIVWMQKECLMKHKHR